MIDYGEIAKNLSTVAEIRQEIRKAKTGSASLQVAGESTAPRNKTEAQLAKMWAEVLQRPSVGIHDNFFELGGDSLRAV